MIDEWGLLRNERDELVVGPLILAEIRRALRPSLGHIPNPRLAGRPADIWTDELRADVEHDFALFLLEGRLAQVFVHATDVNHFRVLLRTRARQFVAGLLRRTELSNLVRRACELLETDKRFEKNGPDGSDHSWGIRRSAKEAFSGSDDDLVRIARRLTVSLSRHYRRDTQRASPILSDADLADLLTAVFRSVGSLDRAQIRVVLREALGLWEVETVSLSMPVRDIGVLEEFVPAPSSGPEADVALIAADTIELLTLRQLRILVEYWRSGRSREEVARRLGISHGTVSNELRRAGSVLIDAAEGDAELAAGALDQIVETFVAEEARGRE